MVSHFRGLKQAKIVQTDINIDVTGPEFVQILIREDGETIWVNTEDGCLLRICRIENLVIEDQRPLAELKEIKNAE